MPIIAETLTDRQVRNLKKDGFHAVGGVIGLYLRIVGINRYWVFRFKLNNKRRDLQFAKYPEKSLKEARERALVFRNLLAQGIDPLEWNKNKISELQLQAEHNKIASKTFRVLANDFIEYQISIGKFEEDSRELRLLKGRLKNYIYPVIGNILFEQVTHHHVAQILTPLWFDHQELCKKIRQNVGQIYKWAKAMQFTDINAPTDFQVLEHLLPTKPKNQKRNHPMIPVKQIPEFVADLHSRPSISAKCLEFAILTASRSANAREALWGEFDFVNNRWTIPAVKMKVGDVNGDHIVPLSQQVKELLLGIRAESEEVSPYVFASPVGGGVLSDASLKTVIQRMHSERLQLMGKGYTDPKQLDKRTKLPRIATPHGTARASFRTWAQDDELGNDRRFSEKIAELCLHHKIDDSYNGAYERNEAMKSRTEMMQAWADYCYSEIVK